ncbi:MAG TPA: ABC transporter substrate-binding protein [Ramlibacter sp.]
MSTSMDSGAKHPRVVVRVLAAWTASALLCAAQAATLVVGQVAPMTGLEAGQGRAYARGMELYFDAVNKAGGVNGHTFSLVRRDDAGRPDETLRQTQELLATSNPMVLAGFFGSRNIAEVVNAGLLEKSRIALVGYRAAEIVDDKPNLYGVRAGLRDELNRMVEHLGTVGITRIGILHEDGTGAAAIVAAATEAAGRAGARIVAQAGHPAGTTRVGPGVDVLVKANPQAILLVSSSGAAAAFVEQYREQGGRAQLFAHSGVDVEQMGKRLSDEQMQGVAIAQVTPSPYKVTSRLGRDLNEAVGKTKGADGALSYPMMEGYITARIIVEAVRRQGGRPTREGTIAALDSIDGLDVGGYVIGYKPGARRGSKFVELSIITGRGTVRQ